MAKPRSNDSVVYFAQWKRLRIEAGGKEYLLQVDFVRPDIRPGRWALDCFEQIRNGDRSYGAWKLSSDGGFGPALGGSLTSWYPKWLGAPPAISLHTHASVAGDLIRNLGKVGTYTRETSQAFSNYGPGDTETKVLWYGGGTQYISVVGVPEVF